MNPEVQKLKHSFWMSILWIVLLLVGCDGEHVRVVYICGQDFHERDADGWLDQRGRCGAPDLKCIRRTV